MPRWAISIKRRQYKRGILFVPVAASSALRAVAPGDVRANIRECRYYIEVLPAGAADPGGGQSTALL
jgi:hypothetical protein